MRNAVAPQAPETREGGTRRSRPPVPFISVAFMAAVVFVPVVIATGFVTESDMGSPRAGTVPLRGTMDPQSLGLRPSE